MAAKAPDTSARGANEIKAMLWPFTMKVGVGGRPVRERAQWAAFYTLHPPALGS